MQYAFYFESDSVMYGSAAFFNLYAVPWHAHNRELGNLVWKHSVPNNTLLGELFVE